MHPELLENHLNKYLNKDYPQILKRIEHYPDSLKGWYLNNS